MKKELAGEREATASIPSKKNAIFSLQEPRGAGETSRRGEGETDKRNAPRSREEGSRRSLLFPNHHFRKRREDERQGKRGKVLDPHRGKDDVFSRARLERKKERGKRGKKGRPPMTEDSSLLPSKGRVQSEKRRKGKRTGEKQVKPRNRVGKSRRHDGAGGQTPARKRQRGEAGSKL